MTASRTSCPIEALQHAPRYSVRADRAPEVVPRRRADHSALEESAAMQLTRLPLSRAQARDRSTGRALGTGRVPSRRLVS